MPGIEIEFPPGSGRKAMYEPHEIEFMGKLRAMAERGEITKAQLRHEALLIHDMKVEFDARMLTEDEMREDAEAERVPFSEDDGYRPPPDSPFQIPKSAQEALDRGQRDLFSDPEPEPEPEPPRERLIPGLDDDEPGPEAEPEPERESVLDEEASRAATAEGIRRAERGTDPSWRVEAYATVVRVAKLKPIFTPDDMWAAGLEKPREPRALGPVMQKAKREGICLPTGRLVKSRIPTQHQNHIAEYESLIYEGGA